MIIATATNAADLFVPLFASACGEVVMTAHLDANQRLIATLDCTDGTDQEVEIPIRSIIDDALRLGSAGVVVAHNHPSGDPRPSEADLAATRALSVIAGSLGIQLHDHIIVGRDGDCRSLRAMGLL